MNSAKIEQIFSILSKLTPHPRTELIYSNNYTLLVSVVLSAQATDVSVNKATKLLFEIIATPEDMVKLGEEKLKSFIKSIGLFNTKARNVILLSKQLIDRHNSIVPNNLADLEALAGVGTKTANVILNCAFGMPTIAVDTHVFRVSRRIGLSKSTTPDSLAKDLVKVIPAKWQLHAHHWLILHGRYVCKAQKPVCETCPISEYCEYYNSIPRTRM